MIMMILFILVFAAVFWLLVRPAFLFAGAKLFRVSDMTFKKAFKVNLVIMLFAILVFIPALILGGLIPRFYSLFTFFERYDGLSFLANLIIGIVIIKKRFKITVFRTIGIYLIFLILQITFVILLSSFVVQTYKVPTSSMTDTLLIGDHLIVSKFDKEPVRGGIIAYKNPVDRSESYLKRVIALAGDTIRISEGNVFVNGKRINEPYVKLINPEAGGIFPSENPVNWFYHFPVKYRGYVVDTERSAPAAEKSSTESGKAYKVPEGHFFALGDNRDFSYDSRHTGPVPNGLIIGKPWKIYWSYESAAGEYLTPPGIGQRLKDILLAVPRVFSRTRWDRVGQTIH